MKTAGFFKTSIIAAILFGLVACSMRNEKVPGYKNPALSMEQRVKDLMGRMSIEEKVAQMCQYVGPGHIRSTQAAFKGRKVEFNDDAYGFYPNLSINDLYRMTEEGMIGSFLHVVTAEEANQLQALAMKSRLGIPLIIGIDCIHGNALVSGCTVYPTPIGQASTFNPDLVRRICEEAAVEMRACGAQWTFTPNVDVARDARWGRIGETFGEDPYLVSRLGVATVQGFQGEDCSGPGTALACVKHLIAGSEPANGTNASPMDVSERTLREVFLPPYKAAVEEAGVATLMTAHNELNGIPCHCDKWLINDVMRGEYGFDGFVVSDWMDIERIYDMHHAAPTMEEAYRQSVDAGMDMHMHGPGFFDGIMSLLKSGRLTEKQIDRSCRVILEAKFRLGLFENPFVNIEKTKDIVFCEAHQATALEAAHESIVLLKNEDGLLPVDFNKYKKIFVTGPNANNHTVLGDWTLKQPEENVVTVLDGIREAAGEDKVLYYDYGDDVMQQSPDKVMKAAALASRSDLAVVVVGENPLRYQKTKTCGENIDRMSLDLLGTQEELVEAIYATGVPTVVILVGGRPLSVNWIAEHVPALIQAWEPGSFAGTALADILQGKVCPSGKLPVSIPRHSGQIQMIYNHKPSQYFHKYKDGESTPLFPFGFGLSYTSFSYGELTLSKTEASCSDSFQASVEVTNIGSVEGTEIVQLYIRDEYSSVTRPVKELKDFARVSLKPGESRTVTFTITPDKLALYNAEMKYVVEPGTFIVMAGPSSVDRDLRTARIEVVK